MNILATIRAEFLHRKGICERVQDDLRTEENKDYYKGKAVAYEEALADYHPKMTVERLKELNEN